MYIKRLAENFVQKAIFVFEIFSCEVHAYRYAQKTNVFQRCCLQRLSFFQRCSLQSLKFFSVVAYSNKKSIALQPTALKSTNWRFSGLNHHVVGFFGLVPKSFPYRSDLCKNPGAEYLKLGPLYTLYFLLKFITAYQIIFSGIEHILYISQRIF